MKPRASVVLVDDHALVRRGLAALLHADGGYRVVGEAGDGERAIEVVRQHLPDLVILDLSMPRLDGLETLRRLRKHGVRAPVLVLSMFDDEHFVAQALEAGARGYLLKHAMDDELFSAVEALVRGERYVSHAIDMEKVEAHETERSGLTSREREVLQLIADGLTTQAIAERLAISPHTATRHRANLMQKLNAHNQVELVRAAVARGLIMMSPRQP